MRRARRPPLQPQGRRRAGTRPAARTRRGPSTATTTPGSTRTATTTTSGSRSTPTTCRCRTSSSGSSATSATPTSPSSSARRSTATTTTSSPGARSRSSTCSTACCSGRATGSASAMFVGTNNAVRISALRAIGGLQDSITEDAATSIVWHAARNPETGARWKSVYTPDVLAVGEGPTTWRDFFTQQHRWACGGGRDDPPAVPALLLAAVRGRQGALRACCWPTTPRRRSAGCWAR